jgi:hypothetical protein
LDGIGGRVLLRLAIFGGGSLNGEDNAGDFKDDGDAEDYAAEKVVPICA